MSIDLILGLDGGGTQTTALLADSSGVVLGRGHGGSANYHAVGVDLAFDAVRSAVHAAFAEAGLTPSTPTVICLGLAGVERAPDRALFTEWAEREWPSAKRLVVNDAELVLAAGTPEGGGLAIICGTGAIVFGKTRDGRTARAGGWGWALGDEGSGHAIGLAALRAVVRAADGRGPQTALTPAILAHWSLAEPTALVGKLYQSPYPRAAIAVLAVLVEEAAEAGDETASAILREAGRELALAAQAVVSALHPQAPTPCALAGGVLVHARQVRAAFEAASAEFGLRLSPMQCVTEPAQGALVLARQLLARQLLARQLISPAR